MSSSCQVRAGKAGDKLTQTTKAIADRLGNDGYAFANANAVPQIDKEKREVAFTIFAARASFSSTSLEFTE